MTFSSSFTDRAGARLHHPTVVWSSAANYGSIPTNSTITVQFSESMDVTTFSPLGRGNFYIYDTLLGTNVAATLSWSADQSIAYLTPTRRWPRAGYYFYVNSGTDLAGNQMQGFYCRLLRRFQHLHRRSDCHQLQPDRAGNRRGHQRDH